MHIQEFGDERKELLYSLKSLIQMTWHKMGRELPIYSKCLSSKSQDYKIWSLYQRSMSIGLGLFLSEKCPWWKLSLIKTLKLQMNTDGCTTYIDNSDCWCQIGYLAVQIINDIILSLNYLHQRNKKKNYTNKFQW